VEGKIAVREDKEVNSEKRKLEVMASKRGESANSACGGAKDGKLGKLK